MSLPWLAFLVSWKPSVHTDDRRTIWEFPMGVCAAEGLHYDFRNTVKPVGNHYHKNGRPCFVNKMGEFSVAEVFWITEGCIREMVLQDVRTNVRWVWDAEDPDARTLGTAGTYIYIPTFVAHAFLVDPGTKMSGVRTVKFDESDLVQYPLISPEGELLPQSPLITG